MPPRIRLPAITPAGATFSVLRSRGLSTTNVRRARRSETDEDGEEIVIDLEQQARDDFKAWIAGPGQNFKRPLWNDMNYLTAYDRKTWQRRSDYEKDKMNMPFPLNPAFRSHPVLSEELKDHIHMLITQRGRTIRSVSAEMGVSLERVGAVVRLKEVEKEWIQQGKPVATYLTKALHSMLPVTPLAPPKTQQPFHEGLQDMVSHPFSHRQTFVPVSESKEFTRVDAGKEFGLPPTEEAVPHPDLIKIAKERDMGLELDERVDLQKERERVQQEQSDKEKMRKAAREKPSKVIEHGRFAWRLKDATTGKVGFRYGVPHQDRKKGQVKIPTHVG